MSHEAKPVKLPAQILRMGGTDAAGICLRCGKHVALNKAVVLEQDSRIAEWHDFGLPEDASWGPALFGDICAKHMRKRARFELEDRHGVDVSPESYLATMKRSLEKTLNELAVSHPSRSHYEFMLVVVNNRLAELSGTCTDPDSSAAS